MKVYRSEGFADQYVFTNTEHWVIQYALWFLFAKSHTAGLDITSKRKRITVDELEKFWSAFNRGRDHRLSPRRLLIKVEASK